MHRKSYFKARLLVKKKIQHKQKKNKTTLTSHQYIILSAQYLKISAAWKQCTNISYHTLVYFNIARVE